MRTLFSDIIYYILYPKPKQFISSLMQLPATDSSISSSLPPPPPLPPIRWLILFLTSWVLCGNFWGYDVVAALNLPLEHYLRFSPTYFQYLLSAYSVSYSLPNCFLPFLGGTLIDRYGSRTLAVSLCALSTFGQLIFTLGLIDRRPGWSIFGRILFGIGGETLSVCQQRITTKWFRGGELALAIGVNLSVARFGSVVNDLVSPVLAHRYSVPVALWGGFLSCFLSLMATCLLVVIDRRFTHLCPEIGPERDIVLLNRIPPDAEHVRDPASTTAIMHNEPERMFMDHNRNPECRSLLEDICQSVYLLKRGIGSLSRFFWMVQLIMVFLLGTTVPFNNIHSAFLCAKYYPNQQEYAAQIMGVPDTISALAVPFAGYYFDKRGHRGHAIVLCSVFIFCVHFCLGTFPTTILPTPIPLLIVLGSAYALLLTFVPVIPLIVPSYFLGTAYGISTSLANFAWAVFPVITAGLASNDPTYFTSEMFFASCGLIGIIVSVYVNMLDKRDYNRVLNLPAIEIPLSSRKWVPVPEEESLEEAPVSNHFHGEPILHARRPSNSVLSGKNVEYQSNAINPRSNFDQWELWTTDDDDGHE